MLDRLRADASLAAVSTDYTATEDIFDTYSNEVILLNERWHTWCCIYRRETGRLVGEVSTFYIEQILPSGRRHAFDSYASFQQHLLRNGYKMSVLPGDYQRQFIHYGAFSKNKSITEKNVLVYRRLAIAAKRGVIPFPHCGRVNALTRRACSQIFNRIFSGAVTERGVYDFDTK
jgi:hypothetical protein